MSEGKHGGVGETQEKGSKHECGGGKNAQMQLFADGGGGTGCADLLHPIAHVARADASDEREGNYDDDKHNNLGEIIDRGC